MNNLYRKYGPNPNGGRDFVAGDLHATFDLLVKALDRVKFNPKADRLFLVGDLVDRGPFSKAVREFLKEPWVFSVRGNHEQIFLDLFANGEPNQAELAFHVERNGLEWVLDLTLEERQEICELFAALPFVIELETARGSVGLLHAEVPVGMTWQEFTARVAAGDGHVLYSAIWGRTRAKTNNTDGVPGIDRVFVGHTPQVFGPKQLGNCFYIDTAAVAGRMEEAPGRLTMANMLCKTEVVLAPAPAVQLVDLRDEPVKYPFGRYAA